jgi:hypothetical protein
MFLYALSSGIIREWAKTTFLLMNLEAIGQMGCDEDLANQLPLASAGGLRIYTMPIFWL